MKELLEDLVPYHQSIFLKELGFNKKCFGFYLNRTPKKVKFINSPSKNSDSMVILEDDCTAPTFGQAFDFLLEKYGLDYSCKPYIFNGTKSYEIYISLCVDPNPDNWEHWGRRPIESFREAKIEVIKKAIDVIHDYDLKKI